MRRKLLHSVVLVLAMLLILTACSNETISSETSVNNEFILPEIPEISEPVTISVPKGGWTGEEAAKAFYFHGKLIEIPFTIESLGDEYSINHEEAWINEENSAIRGIMLNHKGQLMEYFSVAYREGSAFDFEQALSAEAWAINIALYNENLDDYRNILIFNGVRIGSSMEEVEAAFGESDKKTERTLYYRDRNEDDKYCMGFFFDEDGLYSFSIIFENYFKYI
jgi:hypothetical protein